VDNQSASTRYKKNCIVLRAKVRKMMQNKKGEILNHNDSTQLYTNTTLAYLCFNLFLQNTIQ